MTWMEMPDGQSRVPQLQLSRVDEVTTGFVPLGHIVDVSQVAHSMPIGILRRRSGRGGRIHMFASQKTKCRMGLSGI